MPLTNAPACSVGDCGGVRIFPRVTTSCFCDTAVGGINELYFFPCDSVMSAINIADLDWWSGFLGTPADPSATPPVVEVAATMGRSGLGLGSIGKKSTKTDRLASCRPDQLTQVTWALKFTTKCFDNSSERVTDQVMDELITKFDRYLVVARMCDGADRVLPIGVFTTSDFDWVVPETSDDNQSAFYELSWKELGKPRTIDVAGLSTILPKLS